MPEFKNKDEYEKWKAEKEKQQQQNESKTKEIKQQEPVKSESPYVENKSSKKKVYLFIGIILVILIPIVYFLLAYMTHGKLSGNVYLTMKSGDVKKAAGIEILLLKVKDADKFKEEIAKANLEALASIAPLLKQATEAKEMADIYYDLYKSYSGSKKFEEYEDIIGKIKTIWGDYNTKVHNLFNPKVIKKAQTDVDGFYQFSRIKHGKYLVYAHFRVFDENIDWLFPVEVNQRENKLDLTNSNVNAVRIFHDL